MLRRLPTFDSVLVVSFGGPQGLDDIRPFLANVLRGRRVSPERVEEVAHHYELFGGVSPITAITRQQAAGLQDRLAAAGHPLPVFVGMRNWHPLLPDTLRDLRAAGLRRAVGFIAAAQHSYSSCQQYRENVSTARADLRRGWRRCRGDVRRKLVRSPVVHCGKRGARAGSAGETAGTSARLRAPRVHGTQHSIDDGSHVEIRGTTARVGAPRGTGGRHP
jgi:hypothetical protein